MERGDVAEGINFLPFLPLSILASFLKYNAHLHPVQDLFLLDEITKLWTRPTDSSGLKPPLFIASLLREGTAYNLPTYTGSQILLNSVQQAYKTEDYLTKRV